MRALPFFCLLLIAGCGEPGSSTTATTTTTGGSGGTTIATGGAGGLPTTATTGGGGSATTSTGSVAGAGGAGAGAGGVGGTGGAPVTGGAGGTGGAVTTTSTTTTTGTGTSTPCVWGDDCGIGHYCFAPGCGAGTCIQKPVPVGQSPDPVPVCGCDGVTYWNEEVAASSGMSVELASACAVQMPCGPGVPCPGTMKCNRQVPDQPACDPQVTGQCWGTPLSCPLAGPSGRACTNDKCELQCSLIQSQNPWFEDPTCN